VVDPCDVGGALINDHSIVGATTLASPISLISIGAMCVGVAHKPAAEKDLKNPLKSVSMSGMMYSLSRYCLSF